MIGLAAGIGRERSNGVCKYGNDTTLDDECPVACLSVILTVLGDCYWYVRDCNYGFSCCSHHHVFFYSGSKDPAYVPTDTPFTDQIIKGLSVRDIFIFLATPLKARSANCRVYLKSKERDWKCT